MKGNADNPFRCNRLEMFRDENYFFASQDEQSPEQAGAAGAAFVGTSFLADSLYPEDR